MNIAKKFVDALKSKKQPSAYDTPAVVNRIEGQTAWVRLAGSIDETPVQKTIDAQAGDEVNVRVSGGKAWITGNGTAPPTDDRMAILVSNDLEQTNHTVSIVAEIAAEAGTKATYYISQIDGYDGICVHEAGVTDDMVNIDANNHAINIVRDGNIVAAFGSVTTIGKPSGVHNELAAGYMNILDEFGGGIAHFGFDHAMDEEGTTDDKYPFTTLGRRGYGDVGGFSVAEGDGIRAVGYASHAEGNNLMVSKEYYLEGEGHFQSSAVEAVGVASHAEGEGTLAIGDGAHAEGYGSVALGNYSHASGIGAVAGGRAQCVVGRDNVQDGEYTNRDGTYVFIVGNGKNGIQSNALAVKWNGDLKVMGDIYTGCSESSFGGSKVPGTIEVIDHSQFTYYTGFAAYSTSDGNTPTARKYGRIISLAGAFRATVARSTAGEVAIGKVPTGCEPPQAIRFVETGSLLNRFTLTIYADGTMAVSRYGTTQDTPLHADAWLNIGCTYIGG